MRLGLVTYNLARDWDLPTIIEMCEKTGFEGVELRTSHAHGVEVTLSKAQRQEVRKRFEDSAVELAGLGSAFEFDSPDPDEVRRNIEGTKEYVILAADVGAPGIKVRPNRLHEDEGIPKEKTLEQIGLALRECAEFANDYGIQVRLEVHGRDTSLLPNIRAILDAALADEGYPWRRLFVLLAEDGYEGFTLAEIGQPSLEPERFMRYYRALWLAYQPCC